MSFVYNDSGCVKYIRYHNSMLASFSFFRERMAPRVAIIKQSDRPLRYYGDIVEKTIIRNIPIRLKIHEENFETSDKALVDLIFEIEVTPHINGNLKEIEKCVVAYKKDVSTEEWLERQIGFLFRQLKTESLLSIAWADCTADSEIISKFSYFIETLKSGKHEEDDISYLSEMASRIEAALKKIKEGRNLSAVIEEKAREVLSKEFNFNVLEGSCSIKIKDLGEDLNPQNPGDQAVIEYLNLFNIVQEKLIRQKIEFEEVLSNLEIEFQNRKKEIELEQKKIDQEFLRLEQDFERERDGLEAKHKHHLEKQNKEFKALTSELEKEHNQKMADMNEKFRAIDNDRFVKVQKIEDKKEVELRKLEQEKGISIHKIDVARKLEEKEFDRINSAKIREQEVDLELDIQDLGVKQQQKMLEVKQNQVENFEREAELSEREDGAKQTLLKIEMNQLSRENELDKAKITFDGNLEIEKISSELSILEKQKELPEELKDVPYSIEELEKLKAAKSNLDLQKIELEVREIENKVNKLQLDYQQEEEYLKHTSEFITHALQREIRNDEFNFEIVQKAIEREVLMMYAQLDNEQKLNLINGIGDQLTKSIESANWINPDVKIISSLNNENGLVSQLPNLLQTASASLLKSSPWLDFVKDIISKYKKDWFNKPDSSSTQNPENKENQKDTPKKKKESSKKESNIENIKESQRSQESDHDLESLL